MAGKERNTVFTDEFLVANGAVPFSSVIMTPSGYLTDAAWQQVVPQMVSGIRHMIRVAGAKHGIDGETADKLLFGLSFDGFKTHLKNLTELVHFASNNVLCIVEGRDSSEINQVGRNSHMSTTHP